MDSSASATLSPRLEHEYLLAAAPADLLRYLHAKASTLDSEDYGREAISIETQKALLSRNDRAVDIALALVAGADIIHAILKRRVRDGVPDAAVLEAALSNVRSGTAQWHIAPWLREVLPWVAHQGDAAHLKALFENPRVAHEVIRDALRRVGAFEGLDSRRTAMVYIEALRTPVVRRGPIDSPFGADLSVLSVMQAVWGTVLTASPEDRYLSAALSSGLEGAADVIVGPPEFPKILDEPFDEAAIRFLGAVIERWSASESWVGENADELKTNHRAIRELVVAKSSLHAANVRQFVLNHPDVYVRRGYYRGWDCWTLDELKACFAKDGYHFVKAALSNAFFYETWHQSQATLLHECMANTPLQDPDELPFKRTYALNLAAFRKGPDPEAYFAHPDQASEPEEYASRKLEESLDGALPISLTEVHQAVLALPSTFASMMPRPSGWLLCVLGALAGYGLAKMR